MDVFRSQQTATKFTILLQIDENLAGILLSAGLQLVYVLHRCHRRWVPRANPVGVPLRRSRSGPVGICKAASGWGVSCVSAASNTKAPIRLSVTRTFPKARRFLEHGEYQSDWSLLKCVLCGGVDDSRRDTVVDRLLQKYGSFANVISTPANELCGFGGLSNSDILSLRAVHLAAIRLIRSDIDGRSVLNNWKRLTEYLVASLSREPNEHFRVLFLNKKNCLLLDELQTSGTVDHVSIYPREIVRRALNVNAGALILVHNHPSGDPTPSRTDREITNLLIQITRHLSIQIHDHVIVGNGKFVSMKAIWPDVWNVDALQIASPPR
jgi:DNA repair protein RadC